MMKVNDFEYIYDLRKSFSVRNCRNKKFINVPLEENFFSQENRDIISRVVCCILQCFMSFAAIAHLDKVKVWGKSIRVTQSKHTLVQMPKEGQPVSLFA